MSRSRNTSRGTPTKEIYVGDVTGFKFSMNEGRGRGAGKTYYNIAVVTEDGVYQDRTYLLSTNKVGTHPSDRFNTFNKMPEDDAKGAEFIKNPKDLLKFKITTDPEDGDDNIKDLRRFNTLLRNFIKKEVQPLVDAPDDDEDPEDYKYLEVTVGHSDKPGRMWKQYHKGDPDAVYVPSTKFKFDTVWADKESEEGKNPKITTKIWVMREGAEKPVKLPEKQTIDVYNDEIPTGSPIKVLFTLKFSMYACISVSYNIHTLVAYPDEAPIGGFSQLQSSLDEYAETLDDIEQQVVARPPKKSVDKGKSEKQQSAALEALRQSELDDDDDDDVPVIPRSRASPKKKPEPELDEDDISAPESSEEQLLSPKTPFAAKKELPRDEEPSTEEASDVEEEPEDSPKKPVKNKRETKRDNRRRHDPSESEEDEEEEDEPPRRKRSNKKRESSRRKVHYESDEEDSEEVKPRRSRKTSRK